MNQIPTQGERKKEFNFFDKFSKINAPFLIPRLSFVNTFCFATMSAMKKILSLLLASTLLLSACGSQKTSTSEDTGSPYYYNYKSGDFEIEVPEDWEVINAFTNDFPESVRVAFKDPLKESAFDANLVVLREDTNKGTSNAEYSQEKLADHENTLLNYELISREEISLNIASQEVESFLNVFEGKSQASSPTLTFRQVVLVDGSTAWTLTASHLAEEDDFTVERLDHMLTSFNLR